MPVFLDWKLEEASCMDLQCFHKWINLCSTGQGLILPLYNENIVLIVVCCIIVLFKCTVVIFQSLVRLQPAGHVLPVVSIFS